MERFYRSVTKLSKTTGLVITLKPIMQEFEIENVFMTSMQALSGAGRSPGVIALDIMDNVIPYIPKEEEKVQVETKKILGDLDSGSINSAPIKVSCTCPEFLCWTAILKQFL